MKKTIKISLILISIICMTMSVYAASCSMSLQTAKNEFNKNEEFVVDVAISSISDVGEGIIALEGVLEYDSNSLIYEKMEGQNGWETPSYNPANGKLAMLRNEQVAIPETVLKITFKVKEQSAQNATITLKNITVSGGTGTGDIPVSNISKTITVNGGTTNLGLNTNTNTNNQNTNTFTNTNTNTNKNITSVTDTNTNRNIVANTNNNKVENDSMKSGILPKTGTTSTLLIVLAGAIVLTVVFYVKIKMLDKNMK